MFICFIYTVYYTYKLITCINQYIYCYLIYVLFTGSGHLIRSIFGFCDVRNFTDTTECLQEEVMLFVNRIAHILHGIVIQCSGSANKNIG